MPSRINMGPDGGPYIAINENNGNIELEDNTGTTVAIWDDANSQWDFQNNPISNVDSLTSNSVNTDDTQTETIGAGEYHYAGDYDGSDADARLDNAIADVEIGECIYLEAAEYSDSRDITTSELRIMGPSLSSSGAIASGDWTLSAGQILIEGVRLTGSLTITGTKCRFKRSDNGFSTPIDVGADRVIISQIDGGDVTFQSGTSSCIIDTSASVTVTDNGSNIVGDIV